jgi:hypothetical protein
MQKQQQAQQEAQESVDDVDTEGIIEDAEAVEP